MSRILGYIARIVFISGLLLLFPAAAGFFYSEYSESLYFIGLAAVISTTGFLVGRKYPLKEASLLEAMVIASGVWLLVSSIGSLPYVLIARMTPLDAYFEAMSGFTATGMTVIGDVEHVPRSLLLWRAFTQWIGGGGIILLFLLFIMPAGLGIGVLRLYVAEGREERLAAKVSDTVRRIWVIYAFYTVLCIFFLWLSGFNLFDAISHAFATLATGGFSTRNLSIGAFQNPLAETVIIVFMFLGATNFLVHMRMFSSGPLSFIKNIEVKVALLAVAVCSAVIAAELALQQPYNLIDAFRLSIFQVVSIMTTTGFTNANINEFPPLSKAVLVVLMVLGGGTGSTAGGIKIMRLVILVKLVYHVMTRIILPPGTVKPMKVSGHVLPEADMLRVAGFSMAYVFALIVEMLVLTMYGFDPLSSFSAAASAQGTVGPCFLPVTSSLPDIPKITLIFAMWAGRLEIIPVLVLLAPTTWKEFSRLRERKKEKTA